ncbi:50S ribosomal protein L23 [Thermoanaerobacterium sp. RBIITD]|uniref:50S ribosomal protein L23 n=1 Tax=Thermoanaerobacterium sp. RBIITD TaxID=1550240 RepID=UPI000BB7AA48|nr:50S ribosomal protein L23 [Thermoanaerobacterium sp. RBIITD]SNX54372.1 large subunit ribosomal protein L23 [Thermoanaerobacterium sp. RBIITD]
MDARDIIIRPVVTEKSMNQMADRKYTFIVNKNANKIQIKQAAEELFGVNVEKVYTMNYLGKLKRMGKNIGRTSSYKKAIIKLKPNSKGIEFFEGLQA